METISYHFTQRVKRKRHASPFSVSAQMVMGPAILRPTRINRCNSVMIFCPVDISSLEILNVKSPLKVSFSPKYRYTYKKRIILSISAIPNSIKKFPVSEEKKIEWVMEQLPERKKKNDNVNNTTSNNRDYLYTCSSMYHFNRWYQNLAETLRFLWFDFTEWTQISKVSPGLKLWNQFLWQWQKLELKMFGNRTISFNHFTVWK